MTVSAPKPPATNAGLALLGALALLMLLPVTLPVPVLRELVATRFGVSEFLTSLFMSINMVGATIAAPLSGALADRYGHRPRWIAVALFVDAACFVGLTLDLPFAVFMAIRFLEGCAHIVALSLLLGIASAARGESGRGVAMGVTGAGLLLGVAIGAPVGGIVGRDDPTAPLFLGAAVVVFAALVALFLLEDRDPDGVQEARPGLAQVVALVREHHAVFWPLLFAFADRFTVGFFTSTFSLYLRGIHELTPATIGLLIAAFMLPFALLSAPFGLLSQRSSRAVLLCGGSLVYGIGVASLTWWSPQALWWVMPAIGTTAAVMFVPSMLMTTELTPESVRTTSMGAFNAAGSLGFIVGPATGGLVSQLVASVADWEAGYRAAFLVAGAAEIALAILVFPRLRRAERAREA